MYTRMLRGPWIGRRWMSAQAAQRQRAHAMVQQQHATTEMALTDATQQQGANTQVFFVADHERTTLASRMPFAVSSYALQDFRAKAEETMYLYPSEDHESLEAQRVVLVGLGAAEQVDELVLRKATHSAIATARSKRAHDVLLHVPPLPSLDPSRVVQVMTQASMLSNYQFDQYLSRPKDASKEESWKPPLHSISLNAASDLEDVMREQVVLAEETIFARNLGNGRSDVITPAFMEDVARATVADLPHMRVKVLHEAQLREEGLHMFASVGQAATVPPRLVLLEYHGDPSSTEQVALVGKGVTFDTGGLNLKPTGFIEDMHTDMCGSAAVLGAVRAAARLGLKVNIVCALGLAENAIGPNAVKPHTIMTSHSGLTVENNNTDAEGRLVLGDTLSYVQKAYQPSKIVDVATLTGACVVALGEYCAGLFSNSDAFSAQLQAAGQECYERCWRLPILPEHTAELKGTQSDSRSTGKGRYGGASTAAAFLQQFVEKDVEWAHLDIAGPSNYSAARSYFPKGATGFGVQLLSTYLKTHEAANAKQGEEKQ